MLCCARNDSGRSRSDVPEAIVKHLKSIMDDDVLDTLLIRVLDAQSLDDTVLSDGEEIA
ncbi:MAG: hypothetical protein NZT92_20115 [Abditibacteriales bacterium]|nr:hypothetical protein [Abditibacteriales bacterium]MDW8367508.1 hypothetical protein [Abditibacteriales bacterium]